MTLWLVGYGYWPAPKRADRLVAALQKRGVTRLVDTRNSPCSSDIDPARTYGPKAWNLQPGMTGIAGLLAGGNIAYTWLAELGNPQRQDPAMRVLRSHLEDVNNEWPVHRGLALLAKMLEQGDDTIALMCACADGKSCHRTVIAQAVSTRHFDGQLAVRKVVGEI